jgi:hypothetical protein
MIALGLHGTTWIASISPPPSTSMRNTWHQASPSRPSIRPPGKPPNAGNELGLHKFHPPRPSWVKFTCSCVVQMTIVVQDRLFHAITHGLSL